MRAWSATCSLLVLCSLSENLSSIKDSSAYLYEPVLCLKTQSRKLGVRFRRKAIAELKHILLEDNTARSHLDWTLNTLKISGIKSVSTDSGVGVV